jgi:hypothetical protein
MIAYSSIADKFKNAVDDFRCVELHEFSVPADRRRERGGTTKSQKGAHKQRDAMMEMRLLWLFAVLAITASVASADDGHCESLKLKPPLTYTQDKAPRDLSGVVSWMAAG